MYLNSLLLLLHVRCLSCISVYFVLFVFQFWRKMNVTMTGKNTQTVVIAKLEHRPSLCAQLLWGSNKVSRVTSWWRAGFHPHYQPLRKIVHRKSINIDQSIPAEHGTASLEVHKFCSSIGVLTGHVPGVRVKREVSSRTAVYNIQSLIQWSPIFYIRVQNKQKRAPLNGQHVKNEMYLP